MLVAVEVAEKSCLVNGLEQVLPYFLHSGLKKIPKSLAGKKIPSVQLGGQHFYFLLNLDKFFSTRMCRQSAIFVLLTKKLFFFFFFFFF